MTEMCDVRVMKGRATRSSRVERFKATHILNMKYATHVTKLQTKI